VNDPFAPTDSEVRESETLTHVFFALCTALVVAFGAWSYFGRLDVVSSAMGEVIPSSQVKSVQHLEGGIVREILVREGDSVAQDQPLISLEPTASGADVDELRARITALRADVTRLEAEASGAAAPAFAADLVRDHQDLVLQTQAMFKTRRSRINNQLEGQRDKIDQHKQEIAEISSRIENHRKRLTLLNEKIAISEELMKDQLTNRMQHLDLLEREATLEGNIVEDASAVRQAKAAQKGAVSKLEAIRDSFQEKVRESLEKKRRSLEEFTSRVRKFEDSLRRTVLRSPVDGVVKTLHVVTVGGVVSPGGTVVDIVPAGDRLIIEAKLLPQDIGYVHPGQTALVTLASADAIRFGNLIGEVVQVSPDTVDTRDGQPYYRVRIATEQDYFERQSMRYNLVPGVQVTASIRTGQRSVIAYLTDPFLNSARTALRER